MYKILIPTDFSPAAQNAAVYALEVSSQLNNVELNFFHCIEVDDVGGSMVHKVEDVLMQQAENEMKTFLNQYDYNKKTGTHIQYSVVFGNVADEISKKVQIHQTDLIIMGTTGASALEKIFFGSNAASVVEKIKDCPVMVVPENTPSVPFNKIVYATDLDGLKSEAPLAIAFAKIFDARLDVLHVTDNEEKLLKVDPVKKAYELVVEHNYANICFNQIADLDILDGIETYATQTKANLVMMFSRRKTVFEKLFNRSFTKEMAFHAHLPMLVIPYELVLK
jgi:nucleotide-binding universal stress UspA family protein